MLYSQNHQSFPKLSKAMENYGVEDAVITLALEYLDTSKERNNSLLERIPVQSYVNDWFKKENFSNAVKREIISMNKSELTERYVLLIQAMYMENSGEFINFIYDIWGDLGKHDKEIIEILQSRYGDKAKACWCAIFVMYFNNKYNSFRNDYINPQVCIDAVDFAVNPRIKALLCALALNMTEIPENRSLMEKLFTKPKENPIVVKALEYISDLAKVNSDIEVQIALAEGSYFSDKMKQQFIANFSKANSYKITKYAFNKLVNHDRISNLILEIPECVDSKFIRNISIDIGVSKLKEYFGLIAVKYTDEYVNAMNTVPDISIAKQMEDIIIQSNPKYIAKENALKEKTRVRISKGIADCFPNNKEQIRKYLMGSIKFQDITNLESYNLKSNNNLNYISAYGVDDFMKRLITVCTFIDNSQNLYYFIRNYIKFDIRNKSEQYIEILLEQEVNPADIIEKLGKIIDDSYEGKNIFLPISKSVAKYIEKFEDVDVKSMSVTSRCIYLTALGTSDRNKYKSKILAMSGDTSKKIKETLAEIISVNWHDDIVELLQAKKIGSRELAVSVIEKNNNGTFKEELEKAFEKEKSEKLKVRIAGLIGVNIQNTNSEQSADVNVFASLAKGQKAKKVAWLFEQPYKTLNFNDGNEVPEDYLKTLIILYSDMPSIAINKTAVEFAEKINPRDLNDFTVEVFRRWVAKGATAKTKWVMWFCGVHGGHGMIETLMSYIKEWAEHSRGAIASEAVYAMAVNGSSEALMNVDSISRKFKHKQVRSSANKALEKASELLGITKEELSDRIVPDMNFDERMCRTFDYGKRQFNVYLTPTLEIEIYNGEKKVKSMPKPGVNDDKELAEQSYNDFKIMKKQIKTVVANQRQRLEYVLMCDRKWTCENWKKLFVKNPVMHCFAIGLIWGIYKDSELTESFRYMDDGSFTNIDEDEIQLPENASIGLVHPIELSEEQKNAWIEQLSDYEITQPFNQLTRQCFKPTPEELNMNKITRFEGVSIGNYTLRGKLTKQGWETGIPMDAGFFEEFLRNDIFRCVRNSDVTTSYEGYYTEIRFSGMGIDYMEAENVTLGELIFMDLCNKKRKNLNIKDVNPRYFSEIIMQLTLLGNAE